MRVEEAQGDEDNRYWVDRAVEQILDSPDNVLKKNASVPNKRQMTVDTANKLLLDAYSPHLDKCLTKAHILDGGIKQWALEVEQELAEQGHCEQMMIMDGLDAHI